MAGDGFSMPASDVFMLWHEYVDTDGHGDGKLIGIYRTHEAAQAAAAALAGEPGFRDYPDGFEIHPYTLDETHWTEGFVVFVLDEHTRSNPVSGRDPASPEPITFRVRPAPQGYWINEVFQGERSLGCEVGRVGDPQPLAEGVQLEDALDAIVADVRAQRSNT